MAEWRYAWLESGARSAVTQSGTTLMPVLSAGSSDFPHMVRIVVH